MSAGGFGVTVEQFNNIHFHAFPNLASFLSLQQAIVQFPKRQRGYIAIARNDIKEKEKMRIREGENGTRGIVIADSCKFETVIK